MTVTKFRKGSEWLILTDSCPSFELSELDFESEANESELACFEFPSGLNNSLTFSIFCA